MKRLSFLLASLFCICFLSGCAVWNGVQSSGYRGFSGNITMADPSWDYALRTEDFSHFQLYNTKTDTVACWIDGCKHMTSECPAYYVYVTAILAQEKNSVYLFEGKENDALQRGRFRVWCIDEEKQKKELIQEWKLDRKPASHIHWKSILQYGQNLYICAEETAGTFLAECNVANGAWKVYESPNAQTNWLGVDDTQIYYADSSSRVWKIRRDGQDQTPQLVFTPPDETTGITRVQGVIVYIAQQGDQTGVYVYDLKKQETALIHAVSEGTVLQYMLQNGEERIWIQDPQQPAYVSFRDSCPEWNEFIE